MTHITMVGGSDLTKKTAPGLSAPSTRARGPLKARDGRLRENSPETRRLTSITTAQTTTNPKSPAVPDQWDSRTSAGALIGLSACGASR